jgi:hypothetical protein
MFVSRSEPTLAHLEWRVRLFGAGGILAIVGIFTDQGWLIDVAIAVLLCGFALRFLGRRRAADVDDDEDDGGPQPST